MSDNVVGTVGATVNTDGIVCGTVAIAGGGGTSNYNDLINKPSINGVTLSGNKSLSDLGAASLADVAQSVDAALQEAKDSGEFDGPQGQKGDPGAQGPAGGNITVEETLISGEDYELELDDNGEDLAGEIAGVKTDLSENVYTPSPNLYDPSGDTYGIIISSNGAETVNGRWKTSDYIPYPGGYITVTSASAYQVGDGAGFVAWYDSNKNFVTRSQAYGYAVGYKTYSRNDSAYYRICSAIETDAVMVNIGQTLLPYTPYGIVCSEPMAETVQRMIDDNTMPPSGPVWSSMHIPEMAEINSDYQGIATYNPTLTELYALYDALVTAHPDYITKTDLGLDQSGTYHLYSYSFVPESVYISNANFSVPRKPKIMLCSGTHGDGSYGDKAEMVVALYYFLKNICDNWADDDGLTYLRRNVQFEVIPVQNPWGYVNKDRKNSRGVDINRNFLWGWRSGTSGNRDYGGTAPLSEAESIIIKGFIETNSDAIAYLDVHTVGGVPDQDKMVYFDQVPNNTLSVIASDAIIEISKKWNAENIGGLTDIPFHGYIDDDGPLGKIYQWAYKVCGIPAMVFEGFPSFQGSAETVDGDVIMRMCLDEILAVVLKTLAFYKHYNVKE